MDRCCFSKRKLNSGKLKILLMILTSSVAITVYSGLFTKRACPSDTTYCSSLSQTITRNMQTLSSDRSTLSPVHRNKTQTDFSDYNGNVFSQNIRGTLHDSSLAKLVEELKPKPFNNITKVTSAKVENGSPILDTNAKANMSVWELGVPMKSSRDAQNCAHVEMTQNLSLCTFSKRKCMADNKQYEVDMNPITAAELKQKYESIISGGSWKPCDCKSQSKLSIIIPFRDRESHLYIILNNLIPFLQYQKQHFTIFVMEQAPPTVFNRAALLNIGFLESQKMGDYDCFVSHDVDMIPIHLCNFYKCTSQPRHLSVGLDKFDYRLPYSFFFGGVSALDKRTMQGINGYTNIMFGWGGEDDNVHDRLLRKGYRIQRYGEFISRYDTIKHNKDATNPTSQRYFKLSKDVSYMMYDGLNTMNYTVKHVYKQPLYTRILVQIPGPTNNMKIDSYFEQKRDYYKAQIRKDEEAIKNNTVVS